MTTEYFAGENGSFPVVMVGGVLEANKRWDIGNEVTNLILKTYPGAFPIRPKVSLPLTYPMRSNNTILLHVTSHHHRTIDFPLIMPHR